MYLTLHLSPYTQNFYKNYASLLETLQVSTCRNFYSKNKLDEPNLLNPTNFLLEV
jgi:hypothetical protein